MSEQKTEELRDSVVMEGKKIEHGIQNSLDPLYYNTVLGTLEYFGAGTGVLRLCVFDIKHAKYKIWDWLSMALGGRYGDGMIPVFEKLAKVYLEQRDVGGFAQFLAGHDLEIEEPHFCQDCIDTYREVTAPEVPVTGGLE